MFHYLTIVLSTIILFYVVYYNLTKKNKRIIVTKKFKIKKDDKVILKIFDQDKIEYIIEDNIIFLSRFDSKRIWENMQEGSHYIVGLYGFNLPILNINY